MLEINIGKYERLVKIDNREKLVYIRGEREKIEILIEILRVIDPESYGALLYYLKVKNKDITLNDLMDILRTMKVAKKHFDLYIENLFYQISKSENFDIYDAEFYIKTLGNMSLARLFVGDADNFMFLQNIIESLESKKQIGEKKFIVNNTSKFCH